MKITINTGRYLIGGVLALLCVLSVSAADPPLLLRSPAVNQDSIVFGYAGDLWSVPRSGGEARRLTAGPGIEANPKFSMDGSQIAFTGEYDGNIDVFVMPAGGGVPKRLTWHPDPDAAAGWTPDGKRILFSSPRASSNDGDQLFTIPSTGGFPAPLPLPIAEDGSYSPDVARIAYVPLFQWQAAWKRYRGGQTLKIWIADLSNSSVAEIPRQNSNDFNPMWVGDQIYFLSDRNGPVTLFRYDTRTRQVREMIQNRGYDLKSASAGPGAIVYEQFGSLHLFDLRTSASQEVKVRIAGDFPQVRPHYVSVAKKLHNPDISPNGARAVFEARGEILTVPAEKGDPRNLTNSTAVNEREPVWSPDGNSIAYLSDESGEYALLVRDQNGLGSVKKISFADKPGFYSTLRWSPDSRRIAYLDAHMGAWYVDIDAGKPVLVDRDYYQFENDMTLAWSPDSKWLAYSKTLKSHMTAIFIYSLADARTTQATDGLSEAKHPVFDREGKYLYFTASTDSGASMEPDLSSRARNVTHSVYLIVLSKDEKSPLAPESDDEKAAEKKDDSKKDDAKKDDAKTENRPAASVRIDFDNTSQRILTLPLDPRRYTDLQAGKTGIVIALESSPP